jgi:hypothetical protein
MNQSTTTLARMSFVGLAYGQSPSGMGGVADPTLLRDLIVEGFQLIKLSRDLLLPTGKTFYDEIIGQAEGYVRDIIALAGMRFLEHTGFVDGCQWHLEKYLEDHPFSQQQLYDILVDLAILVYRVYHPRAKD